MYRTFQSGAACAASAFALLATGAVQAAPCAPGSPQLVISHAGSLNATFQPVEALFTARTGVCIVDLEGGSVKLARELLQDRGTIDIFASADPEVNDRMLKPAGLASYTIRFAEGAMVLAYTTASKHADTIATAGAAGVAPRAAADWAAQLAAPGVTIGASHPFLDPGGYRADMMLQLAQLQAGTPQLYNTLLSHVVITRSGDTLGKTFDYQFTYDHSARAALARDKTGTYRYVTLPDAVNLGAAGSAGAAYAAASVTMPGIAGPGSTPLRMPATRVAFGLSIVADAPNRQRAEQFLALFLSPEGVALRAAGPTTIDPAQVDQADIAQVPAAIRTLVRAMPAATLK